MVLLPQTDKRLPGTSPVCLRQTVPIDSGESLWIEGPSLTRHRLPFYLWALEKDTWGANEL